MKEKLKNSLTISEKDKKLLVYVFAFLIIFIAYFVGYQNLSTSLDTSTKQVTELTKKKKDLQKKNDNKAKYESDTLSLQSDSSMYLTKVLMQSGRILSDLSTTMKRRIR